VYSLVKNSYISGLELGYVYVDRIIIDKISYVDSVHDYLLQLSFVKDRQVCRLAERGVSVDGSWHDENRLTLGCAGQPTRR
jgi:hypothetical protein